MNKVIRDMVDVSLNADYVVPSIYRGSRMMTCKGIHCNTAGTVVVVMSDGTSRTLKVSAGTLEIDGIKTIKSTGNGTTVGAVSILYG